MTVQLAFCFIQVVGGYVNVAQIGAVFTNDHNVVKVCTTIPGLACQEVEDKTPADFLDRTKHVCGGKSGDGR